MNIVALRQVLDQTPLDYAVAPVDAYQQLVEQADQLQAFAKNVRAFVDRVSELRYGEQARAQLLTNGSDTGTTHVIDGDFDITVEIDKTVTHDQEKLAEIFQRIATSGEDPRQYIDVKFTVSERKYSSWPEVLRAPFAAVRTVKPGKPKYTIKRIREGRS